MNQGHNSNLELRSLVDRIESLEHNCAEIKADIKDIYTEAKNKGYDAKALRQVIKIRSQDREKREELESLVDIYLSALGDLASTPLGQSAMARAGLMPPV